MQTVAAATEQLASSINDFAAGRRVRPHRPSGRADRAQRSHCHRAGVSQPIGEVVSLINLIAEQTNLLALNATIEPRRRSAALCGGCVRGASLANQTAKATEGITSQVAAIQGLTGRPSTPSRASAIIQQMAEIANCRVRGHEQRRHRQIGATFSRPRLHPRGVSIAGVSQGEERAADHEGCSGVDRVADPRVRGAELARSVA